MNLTDNLYRLELDVRSLEAPGGQLDVSFVYKVMGTNKERTITLTQTELETFLLLSADSGLVVGPKIAPIRPFVSHIGVITILPKLHGLGTA